MENPELYRRLYQSLNSIYILMNALDTLEVYPFEPHLHSKLFLLKENVFYKYFGIYETSKR